MCLRFGRSACRGLLLSVCLIKNLSAVFAPPASEAPQRVVKLSETHEMERHTRSKRKVRFEEPPVADVRTSGSRPRRKAAALEPVVVEETAVPGEATLVEVRVKHQLGCAHCGATSPHMRVCACAGAEQSSSCARGGAVRNGGPFFHSSYRDG